MKTICFVSGKGGTGKTTIACNSAFALADEGKKVLLFDANFGLSNVELVLGVDVPTTIGHVVRDKRELKDALVSGIFPFDFIAGGTGMSELFALTSDAILKLLETTKELSPDYDYIIFDAGPGLGSTVNQVIQASDTVIVVTTPDVTSLTDTYAVVQQIHANNSSQEIMFVVNRVMNELHGSKVANSLKSILGQFLSFEVVFLGSVRFDKALELAVNSGQLVTKYDEKAPGSVDLFDIGYSIIRGGEVEIVESTFLERLKSKFSKNSDDDSSVDAA